MLILASVQVGAVEFNTTDGIFFSDSQRNFFSSLNDGLNSQTRVLGNVDSKLNYSIVA